MYFAQTRGYFSDRQIKNIRITLILILVIISGTRYKIGTDYDHYTNIFNLIRSNQGSYVEFGYELFNYPFFLFGDLGIYVLFFVSSTIIIFSFDYFIKGNFDNNKYFMAWFLFLTTGILFSSFNAIRQYLAIAIFIFSLKDLYSKKYYRYLMMVLIAAQFHTSAYILLLILPMRILLNLNPKFFKKTVIFIYILSLVFLVLDFREILKMIWFVVPDRWQWYIVSDFFNSRNVSAIVKQVLPNILVISLLLPKGLSILRTKVNSNEIDYIRFSLFIIFVSLSNVFYGIMVLQRFIYYFEIFYVYVIVFTYSNLDYTKVQSRYKLDLIKVGLVLYFIVWYLYLIYVRNAHTIYPYRNILEVLFS